MPDSENRGPENTWGVCRFCGVAVPNRASRCLECGAEGPLSPSELRRAPKRMRRRVWFTGFLRTFVVAGVIVVLAYALLSAVLQGPPVLSTDPLTTNAGYIVGPGNFTVISGEITGGDYVIGNYSSFDPSHAIVGFVVYNSSEWAHRLAGDSPTPTYAAATLPSGRIIFSAPVTDTYYFVFTNPYPVTSHLTIGVYVTTQYESNVGDDGFG
jgi:hypothetical protein